MKASRILYSLLLISITCLSCSSPKEAAVVRPVPGPAKDSFPPLYASPNARLFKAGLSIGRHHHSGLFLVKHIPADSSVRILFLSELGLSLMDMEYSADEFRMVSVRDFLDRPALLKMLEEDFRTLLLDLSRVDGSATEMKTRFTQEDDTLEVLKVRHRSQRYTYSRYAGSRTHKIVRRKGLFGKVEYRMPGSGPLRIWIHHRGLRLQIELVELEHSGNDAG
jgi:hypothetical protein